MILQEFVGKCHQYTEDQMKTQITNLRNMFKQEKSSLELLQTIESTLNSEAPNPKEIIEDIVSKLSTCK